MAGDGDRRWGLAAAIACVAVFGLSVGEGGPLLSLMLEARGTDATLNGLNAAATFAGVMLGPLLTPRLVRLFGLRRFLLGCFALDMAVFSAAKYFDAIGPWFALRMLMGVVGSSIFTASEAWINLLAGDASRGRVLGLYAAALSAGFGLGPLILTVTGIDGWAPFLANNLITAAAALPLFFVGGATRSLGRERGPSPLAMVARAPIILLAVALFGFYETALLTLLPVWGVRTGLGITLAAALLTSVYFGSIAMQLPIGWLSDHMPRATVLRLCGLAGLLGAVLIAALPTAMPVLFVLVFLWGGAASGVYPVALGMAGDRFKGGDLVAVNAAMIVAYGTGALLGPALGGAAMDAWGPQGLLALFVLLFAAFLAAVCLPAADGRASRR